MKTIGIYFIVITLMYLNPLATKTRAEMPNSRSVTLNSVQDLSSPDAVDLSTSENPVVLHVTKSPLLTLADFDQAEVSTKDGRVILQIKLKNAAAARLNEFSKKNVGRRLAMLVDHQLVNAPLIRVPITGNSFQFDAVDLARVNDVSKLINEQTMK